MPEPAPPGAQARQLWSSPFRALTFGCSEKEHKTTIAVLEVQPDHLFAQVLLPALPPVLQAIVPRPPRRTRLQQHIVPLP